MALKTTINLSYPDKTETRVDVTVGARGYWQSDGDGGWELVKVGNWRREATDTVQTWFACTLSACETAAAAYSGDGSYSYEETNEIVHSYMFQVIETTVKSEVVN